jgi:hypothetical protein
MDDDRIADIQRVCHEVQATQVRMLEDHHRLSTRVALVETRVTSHEREIDGKLDMLHHEVRTVNQLVAEHMKEEEADRKELIAQQRATMRWLAGLVFTTAGGLIMFLLAELPK